MEQKDDYIRIRVSEELKQQFQTKCKKNAINGSEWLRQQIERFVKVDLVRRDAE